MWKRDNDATVPPSTTSPTPAAPPSTARAEPESAPHRAPEPASGGRAVIGPSIDLTGNLVGSEDLYVEGRIQGKIDLAQNALTVGPKGRVSAEVHARVVHVEGEVDGNLRGEEVIVLRKSARVRGDLTAPRVVIEDGARFKGTIDMEPKKPAAVSPAGPRGLEAPAVAAPASPAAAQRT